MESGKKLIILFIFLFFLNPFSFSNPIENDSLISISGQIVNSKGLNPIPLAHIIIKRKRTGRICDNMGIFHLQVKQSDTLQISALGHKTKEWAVPFIFDSNQAPFFQILMEETSYLLSEVDIYALGTWNEFKDDFIKLKVKDEYAINDQILKELAPFKTKEPNIVPPQYRPIIESPHLVNDFIFLPSFLYTKFGRKEKQKRKVARMIRNKWKTKKFEQFYNAEIVTANTGLEGDELLEFMTFCGPKLEITEITSQYDVLEQIVNNYKAYISTQEEKPSTGK